MSIRPYIKEEGWGLLKNSKVGKIRWRSKDDGERRRMVGVMCGKGRGGLVNHRFEVWSPQDSRLDFCV